MNNALAVAVTSIKRQKVDYEDELSITVAFENKGDKDIAGAKGHFIFNDMFGAKISRIGISYDSGVKAKKTAMWHGSKHINMFGSDDTQLANTPLEKMHIEWVPVVYVFADGTKLEASDPD